MKRPNLARQRFLNELNAWLTPGLLYHCFTGESDPERLAHVERLYPALQGPLLAKAERQWPAYLQAVAERRLAEQRQSQAMVRGYIRGPNDHATATMQPPPHCHDPVPAAGTSRRSAP